MTVLVPFNKLIPSKANVRHVRTDLAPLVASLRSEGILQNLVVVAADNGRYEVIAGERRRQAAAVLIKQAFWPKDQPIPCEVRDPADAVAISLAENVERVAMLGHVSGVSSDGGGGTLPCLLRAARSAYPKSWRRAAWNKHLRAGERRRRRRTARQHACHAGVVEGGGALRRAAHLTTGQNLSS